MEVPLRYRLGTAPLTRLSRIGSFYASPAWRIGFAIAYSSAYFYALELARY